MANFTNFLNKPIYNLDQIDESSHSSSSHSTPPPNPLPVVPLLTAKKVPDTDEEGFKLYKTEDLNS